MNLCAITLPTYTPAQEKWNYGSHLFGAALALAGAPFMLAKVIQVGDWLSIVAVCVYLVSLVLMYLGSAAYHWVAPGSAKRALRIIDHSTVFFLIMGSYAPYTLIGLRNPVDGFPWGYLLFGLVWGLCGLGIAFNFLNMERYRVINLIICIAVGSCIVAAFIPLYHSIGAYGVLTLLASGCFYWAGSMLYAIGKGKNAWLHTVFHFFVIAATIVMFLSIYFFVL